MIKELKFLAWTVNSKILSKEKFFLRTNSLSKSCQIIENEINSSGGILNRPIKVIYKNFTEAPKGYDELINFISNNDDIVAMTGGGTLEVDEYILKNIDLEKMIYFTFIENHKIRHKNLFITTQTAKVPKIKFAEYFINTNNSYKKILFLHEGKRFYKEFTNILKIKKKNFKDYDLSKLNQSKKIDEQIINIIKNINDEELLLLDVKPDFLLPIFNYFNKYNKSPTVLKFYGLIDGRIEKYNFPLIEIANNRSGDSLSFSSLCDQIDKNMSSEEKSFIFSSIYRSEIPLLFSHVAKKLNSSFSDQKSLVSKISCDINTIDGEQDIFLGKTRVYSFKNNENTNKITYNYIFPKSLQNNNQLVRTFYPIQFLNFKNKIVKVNVNYAYIDIIRITQIDIGESIWSCEFFVDINSIHDDPLNVIKFNNLSLINSKFETKLVKKTKDEQFGGTNYRYYIVANFDFFAIADNYPFDWQHIYISMSISDRERYGILQPVPEALLDKEFQLDGWRLMDAKTGILRKKETHHQNANLTKAIEIREEIRVGWTIARTNVVTTMKVAIPIIFLFFLNYYTVFLPFENATTAIGVLTTTFLSGIALYFSTEKPQPLRITTIDLIFIYYYLQVGLTVIITGVTSFINEEIYINSMMAMRFILPISIIVALTFLYRRIKSVRLMPRID